jgi:hypothetical protein
MNVQDVTDNRQWFVQTSVLGVDVAGVTVRSYRVIYDLLDDMRAAMEGKLAALEQRIPIGEAEVRAVFGKGSKLVAGCMVTEGSLREDCFVVVGLPALLAWQHACDSVTK